MTEAEWLTTPSPGTIVEIVRRRARFRPGVAGRKARLAACEILRLVVSALGNPTWETPIDLAEQYSEGKGRLADVDAAIDVADEVVLLGTRTTKDVLRGLTKPDPLAAAYGAFAGAEHFLQLAARSRPHLGSISQRDRVHDGALAALRDIFGNPFRPVTFDPAWRTDTVVSLAKGMYESRDFSPMPILADAMQDAGCEDADVLEHCRDPNGVHVRGCWVVDLVLGRA